MTHSTEHVVVESLLPADYAALEAASSGSAVLELGALPTLIVTGPDRLSWLNGLLTADVHGVRAGVGAWGLLLDRLGKIQAVLGVVGDAERTYIAVLWGDATAVLRELDARLVMEDAELSESPESLHWRLWVGPDAPSTPPEARAWGSVDLVGRNLLAVFTGNIPDVNAASTPSLSPAAWGALRVRHGLPWGGIDFDHSVRPHEAALERRAVSWAKGCYLGQEVVCMQDMRGKVKRSIRPFRVSGGAPDPAVVDSALHDSEKGVGRVTTAVFDAREQCSWVLAQVPLAAMPDAPPPAPTLLTWTRGTGETLRLETIAPRVAERA